jgi:cytoskeletal protein CcmA (bactofilin family)
MWRKEDGNAQASPNVSQQTGNSLNSTKPSIGSTNQSTAHKPTACVSQGIRIKGEVRGSEDLFIDGLIEGTITLENSGVTIGPNGTVKADIVAREVTLRGFAEGKFTAEDSIQIWHTARVHGDLKSQRISIEDGAELRGKVEAGKVSSKIATDDTSGRAKKAESGKANEAAAKNSTPATGAATAGAD